MNKENFNGYECENTSTRILSYPLTTLRTLKTEVWVHVHLFCQYLHVAEPWDNFIGSILIVEMLKNLIKLYFEGHNSRWALMNSTVLLVSTTHWPSKTTNKTRDKNNLFHVWTQKKNYDYFLNEHTSG
jgi:hypothetical protein